MAFALFSSDTRHSVSDGEVKVCLPPEQLYILSHCPTTVPDSQSTLLLQELVLISALSGAQIGVNHFSVSLILEGQDSVHKPQLLKRGKPELKFELTVTGFVTFTQLSLTLCFNIWDPVAKH